MPRQLRRDLPEFEIRTVQEEGWSSVQNGELLRRASESFEVMVTADQRLQYQQDIGSFDIGVVVIVTVDTRLPNLQRLLPRIRDAIRNVPPGSFSIIEGGPAPKPR
jgi:hypothetical protein